MMGSISFTSHPSLRLPNISSHLSVLLCGGLAIILFNPKSVNFARREDGVKML